MTPSPDISRLLEIMAALRTPVSGCPWDLEQDFATIAPYTIEEAYEVVDAIARGDLDDVKDELGDLLLQVVFHARMAEEQNAFSFGDVVEAITRKMIRRHPRMSLPTRTANWRRPTSRTPGTASRPRRRPSARRGGQPKSHHAHRCYRASRPDSRR
jgi:NTP pyrophosphatase (non-canonical NTP hydrolase)